MKTTTNNHKIRVLQITGTMNMGGQETFIMNLFRNIDRDKFEFDFAIHDDKETNYYEDEIKKLGRIPEEETVLCEVLVGR